MPLAALIAGATSPRAQVRVRLVMVHHIVLLIDFAIIRIAVCSYSIEVSSPSLHQLSPDANKKVQLLQKGWKRVFLKGNHTVDNDLVTVLLSNRTAAKLRKEYAVADRAAEQLRMLGVCYDDSQFTWYTRNTTSQNAALNPLLTASERLSGVKRARKEKDRPRQENKRRPRPARRVENESCEGDDSGTEGEGALGAGKRGAALA